MHRFLALVAEGEDQVVAALERAHLQFRIQRILQRLLAHGAHHAAGAQHGQPAHDAQARIEGLFRDFPTAGDGDRDPRGTVAIHAAHRSFDHLPGHRIDGGLPPGKLQAILGDRAHALAGAEFDLAIAGQKLHPGDDLHALRDVRVVAAVLEHPAAAVGVGENHRHVVPALGHGDAHLIGAGSVPLPQAAGQGRSGGAASGGEALAQDLHRITSRIAAISASRHAVAYSRRFVRRMSSDSTGRSSSPMVGFSMGLPK